MEIILRQLLVIFGFLLAVILVARLLREHRPPGNTMAWLLAIILLPYVGVPLYLIFGGRKLKRIESHREPLPLEFPDDRPFKNDIEKILCSSGIPRSRVGNRLHLLTGGKAAYFALVDLIEQAEESLSIATFILGSDAVGREIVNRLARRAHQGIKVRLLLDALGSFWTKRGFVEPLRVAGGKVGVFLPMVPLRRKWSANLRNHRKIWIADQKIALVGGRNISGEYLGPEEDPARWPDFNLKIEGPAVGDLVDVFASDWEFATHEAYRRKHETHPDFFPRGDSVQVVPGGPDTTTNALYQGILTAILSAQHRVWIVTPYFIPDEMLIEALSLAARLGRDVKIIIPSKSNHRLADFARASFLRGLKPSGVQCYLYRPGMFHTKMLVVDDGLAVVGSANMDMRSLYLNFEIGLFIYNKAEVEKISMTVLALFKQSTPLEFPVGAPHERAKALVEDVSRLFAPLL